MLPFTNAGKTVTFSEMCGLRLDCTEHAVYSELYTAPPPHTHTHFFNTNMVFFFGGGGGKGMYLFVEAIKNMCRFTLRRKSKLRGQVNLVTHTRSIL